MGMSDGRSEQTTLKHLDPRVNRRWDLVVLGILVNACLGTVYSWSVFRAPLEETLGITAAQSGIPYSVFLGAFAFSMPVAGALISRIGPRLTLAIGGVLVGAGWVAGGLFHGFVPIVAAYGVIGGVGVGFAYGVPLTVVGTWFPDRRGLAMGFTLAGFGVSPFVTAPVAELLIMRIGVQDAMVVLGLAFVLIVAGLSPVFRERVEDHVAPTAAAGVAAAGDVELHQLSPRRMVRTKSFYGLWVCYVIGTLAGLTAIGMTASFGREVAGLSVAGATASVAAFGILNGVGRPLFGGVHDALGVRSTVVIAFVLIAAGASVSLLARPGLSVPFFVGFGILWLMLGGWLAIGPAATSRLYGSRDYARNYGIMYTAYGVGALIGGGASGALYSRFGSYDPMLVFVLILCAAGIGLAVALLPAQASGGVSGSA